MVIKPLRKDLVVFIGKHHLVKKWEKAARLFQENAKHPSLNTELLEPRWRGIYSFRLDRRYRVLFFIDVRGQVEVFQITNHYK